MKPMRLDSKIYAFVYLRLYGWTFVDQSNRPVSEITNPDRPLNSYHNEIKALKDLEEFRDNVAPERYTIVQGQIRLASLPRIYDACPNL